MAPHSEHTNWQRPPQQAQGRTWPILVLLLGLATLALALTACGEGKVLEIEIEPEKVPHAECGGLTNLDGCMVMHGPDGRQYLHWGIEGFSYEEGYTWTLKVRRTKNDGPDETESPTHFYTLIEIVSKVPVE